MKRKNLVLTNLSQCWEIRTNNMEEIIFKTKKMDKVFLSLYLGISIFLLIVASYTFLIEDDIFVFLPMGIIIGLLLFLSFGTQYFLKIIIKENRLIIKLIFKIYSVDINKITKIRKGETLWSGFHKYGTATKGLIIFAKYHNDLYITPENYPLFVENLQKINPDIIVEEV